MKTENKTLHPPENSSLNTRELASERAVNDEIQRLTLRLVVIGDC